MRRTFLLMSAMLVLLATAQAQSITVTSPNGSESWTIGSARDITWNARGISGNANVVLFRGTSRVGIIKSAIPVASGSFRWVQAGKLEDGTFVPAGNDYKIKVRSVSAGIEDLSDGPFTLAPALVAVTPAVRVSVARLGTTVHVTFPNTRSVFFENQVITIRWDYANARPEQYVRVSVIRYATSCRDESAADVLNLGQLPLTGGHLNWEVANNFRSCENCVVRISPVTAGDFPADTSDECFILHSLTSVRVLAPNGGENFVRGSPVNIRWEVVNPYPGQRFLVSLRYFNATCTSWSLSQRIAEFPIDSREFVWPVLTTLAAGRYAIHVSVVRGGPGSVHIDAEDVSDSCFNIR